MGRDDEDLNQPTEADDEREDEVALKESSEPDEAPEKHEDRKGERSEGLDAVKSYLRDIRHSTLLTFEQEQELGKRMATGDFSAREQMIESNLRLVVSIGKRYMNRGLPFADIVEGPCRFEAVGLGHPLLPEARSWLNAKRLARLPKGAIVVNSSRGPVVDDEALIAALKSGHVAAAGLDVFTGEPLPLGSRTAGPGAGAGAEGRRDRRPHADSRTGHHQPEALDPNHVLPG